MHDRLLFERHKGRILYTAFMAHRSVRWLDKADGDFIEAIIRLASYPEDAHRGNRHAVELMLVIGDVGTKTWVKRKAVG